MKIAFISNYFNHHQKYISDAFSALTEDYSFIETSEMSDERKKLGYQTKEIPSYVTEFKDFRDGNFSKDIINNADAVIAGNVPDGILEERIKSGKLLFRYSERLLKNGSEPLKFLPRYVKLHKNNPKNGNIYLLCSSGYAAKDYASFGLFKNKAYKWGYFPETKVYEKDSLFSGKDRREILWCGRFLAWKHPEDVLYAVKKLSDDGCDFKLKFIGTGEKKESLDSEIKRLSLENKVEILPSLPPEEIRKHMEKSGIYLLTSDRKEGWGAVLNEAMNSGCAVIASDAAGAVPYLIKDRENGFSYRSGDIGSLYVRIKYLLDNESEQERLGRSAYETVVGEWNAETAAKRLITLTEAILSGEKFPDIFESGPCGKA